MTMRLVVINRACVIKREGWRAAGWSLLKREALFERDYLLPAPAGNYGSCKREALKYAVGSAIQTRVMSILKIGEEPLFRHRWSTAGTPHSGRNFLPPVTGALGYAKQVRDVLGGARKREINDVGQTAHLSDAGGRHEDSPGQIEGRSVV